MSRRSIVIRIIITALCLPMQGDTPQQPRKPAQPPATVHVCTRANVSGKAS